MVRAFLLLSAAGLVAQQQGVFSILSSTAKLGLQPGGAWLIPTSQLVQPFGERVTIAGRPVEAAFDADRKTLAVLNSKGVLFYDGTASTLQGEVKSRSTSYAGLAFRPGTREVWASEATRNGPDGLLIITLDEHGRPAKEERIPLKPHPLPVGIVFSQDGSTAYVALSRNNTLALFDAKSRQLQREVPVGIAPHAVALSQTFNRLFVSNRGGRKPLADDVLAPTSGARIASQPEEAANILKNWLRSAA